MQEERDEQETLETEAFVEGQIADTEKRGTPWPRWLFNKMFPWSREDDEVS